MGLSLRSVGLQDTEFVVWASGLPTGAQNFRKSGSRGGGGSKWPVELEYDKLRFLRLGGK